MYPPAFASCRSCASLYLTAGPRCVSDCYPRGGGSDRVLVLLGLPMQASCRVVLQLSGVCFSRSQGTVAVRRGHCESSRSHHRLLCWQWLLGYRKISLCMISGLHLALVCIVVGQGEWLGDELSLKRCRCRCFSNPPTSGSSRVLSSRAMSGWRIPEP